MLFTNFKKYFLVFLCASIITSSYSMDDENMDFSLESYISSMEENIFPSIFVLGVMLTVKIWYQNRPSYLKRQLNLKLLDKFKIAKKSGFSEEICQEIIELFEKGVDPNYKFIYRSHINNDECIRERSTSGPNHYTTTSLLFLIRETHEETSLLKYLLNNSDLNIALSEAITPCKCIFTYVLDEISYNRKKRAAFYMKVLEGLYDNGVNLNSVYRDNVHVYPSLSLAAIMGDIDLVNFLLKHNVNVEGHKVDGYDIDDKKKATPLAWALVCGKNEDYITIVKKLCDEGALLVKINYDNTTAFHNAINRDIKRIHTYANHRIGEGFMLCKIKESRSIQEKIERKKKKKQIKNENRLQDEKYIEAIMTHASCFDDTYEYGEKEEKDIITALLVFKKLNINFSNDTKFLILEKVSPNYCFKNVFEKVSNEAKQKYIFKQVCQRVDGLQNVLQICDNNDNTALQELLKSDYTDECKQKLRPLLDGRKLTEDFEKFDEEFPNNTNLLLETNLAFQMYKNVLQLLERKHKKCKDKK